MGAGAPGSVVRKEVTRFTRGPGAAPPGLECTVLGTTCWASELTMELGSELSMEHGGRCLILVPGCACSSGPSPRLAASVRIRALPVLPRLGAPGPAGAGPSPFSRSPELLAHAHIPRVDAGPSSAHAGAPGRAVVRFVSAPSGEGTCLWPHSWPSTHPNSRCSAASLTLSRCPWWPPARAPVLREPFGSTPGSVHVRLF